MRARALRGVLLGALVLALACADAPTAPEAVTGNWGGDHVRLTVTPGGGQLEFDCAHGAMTGSLAPDSDGRFSAPGYYVAEQGGPVREDPVENRRPTVYAGRVTGSTLTFGFTVNDQPFGPFTLTRDRPANIRKCL